MMMTVLLSDDIRTSGHCADLGVSGKGGPKHFNGGKTSSLVDGMLQLWCRIKSSLCRVVANRIRQAGGWLRSTSMHQRCPLPARKGVPRVDLGTLLNRPHSLHGVTPWLRNFFPVHFFVC